MVFLFILFVLHTISFVGLPEPARAGHGAELRDRALARQNLRRLLRGDHGEERQRAALRHSAQLQSHLLSAVHPEVATGQPV